MLSREEVLTAEEIYMYDGCLYILPKKNGVVHTLSPKLIWGTTGNESFWDVWDDNPTLFESLTGEEALKIMDAWEINTKQDSDLLNKAIIFATERHAGQYRKSTKIPYILHPLEVVQILYSMKADTNLLIAGVLHDTVEDTNTTLEEIRELFGVDVAQLVDAHSEDKSRSWQERKQHTITELGQANIRIKMLALADKLSNLRSIASDYETIGDELWERFNAPKEKQAWYYSEIQDALFDMQTNYWCKHAYWEFVGLFKDVFVKFLIDKKREILYQLCITGECYYLKRNHPFWQFITDEVTQQLVNEQEESSTNFYKLYSLFENTQPIARKEAEFLVDCWLKDS